MASINRVSLAFLIAGLIVGTGVTLVAFPSRNTTETIVGQTTQSQTQASTLTTTAFQTTTATSISLVPTTSTTTEYDTSTQTQLGTTTQTSTTTQVYTTTTTPPLSQSFGIGTSQYSSNINYFINDGGSRIDTFTVTYTLAGPLRGTTAGSGNFSFQVNGYSPNGYVPAYMQWVIQVGAASSGLSRASFEVYYIQANDGLLIFQPVEGTIDALTVADFAAGTTIAITVNTNSTGDVNGASGTIRLADGVVVFSASDAITTYSQETGSTEGTGNAQAPVVGFETQLIGEGSSSSCPCGDTTFTQASGTISYVSSTALVAGATPVGLPYVQYNGEDDGIPNGTIEKSNITYGSVGTAITITVTITSIVTLTTTNAFPAKPSFRGFWMQGPAIPRCLCA